MHQLCATVISRARHKGQRRRQINVESCRRSATRPRDDIFKCEQRIRQFQRRGRGMSGKSAETRVGAQGGAFIRCSAGWWAAAQLVIVTSYFDVLELLPPPYYIKVRRSCVSPNLEEIHAVLFMQEEDWLKGKEGKKRLTRGGLCFLDDERRRFWLRFATRSTENESVGFSDRQVYKSMEL